jgi:hypothetical protein
LIQVKKRRKSGIIIELTDADTNRLEEYRKDNRTEDGKPLGVGAAGAKLISEALSSQSVSSTRP